MTIGSEGQVLNPVTSNNPVSTNYIAPTLGRQGEYLASGLRGKYATAALNRALFSFNVTAVTIPKIAATLASVFSIWNPVSSGVIAELVDTEVGVVLATTVVDNVNWYFSSGAAALAGTFATPSVAGTNHFSARTGDNPNPQIIPYTSYTHSGTPVRCDMICSFGATAVAVVIGGNGSGSKVYDGRLLVPPGVVISVAVSTTVWTTSGADLSARWIEWPFA